MSRHTTHYFDGGFYSEFSIPLDGVVAGDKWTVLATRSGTGTFRVFTQPLHGMFYGHCVGASGTHEARVCIYDGVRDVNLVDIIAGDKITLTARHDYEGKELAFDINGSSKHNTAFVTAFG